jgi:hypothetical protein
MTKIEKVSYYRSLDMTTILMQVYSTVFFKSCVGLKPLLVRMPPQALSLSIAKVKNHKMVQSDLLQRVVTLGTVGTR